MNTPTVNERSLAIGGAMGKRAMLYLGMLVFAFALLLLVSSSNASAADVYVSGSVSGTWSTGDNIYVVADATVDAGDNLTIQAGVNVYFDPGTSLLVNGQLIAISNDSNRPINFTSNATIPGAGDWVGINFEDAMAAQSIIDGAHVEFATNGVYVLDSDVALSNLVVSDCSEAGVILIRDSDVATDLTVTLNRLDVSNVFNGIIVQGLDRNLTVTIINCNVLNAANVGIAVATGNDVLDWDPTATVSITNVSVSTATYGVFIRAYDNGIDLEVDGLTADGMGVAGIQAWCDGLNDITLSNIILNNTGVEGLGFQSWSNDIVATVDSCVLTNISTLDAIVFNCFEGSVEASVTNVEISGAMDEAAIWVSANLSATVTLENVEISGSETGVYLAAAYDTASLDLVDVLITGPNLNQGIIVEAEGANAVFNAVGLTVIGAENDGVLVTSYNGAVEADISLADIEDIGYSGMLFYSEWDFVNLTLTDSTILNIGLDGIVAQGVTEVNLVFDNVTIIGALDGVLALSTDGNVMADLTNTTVAECETGVRILAPNGWITMGVDPSSIQSVGTGIYLDAMGSVNLSIIDSFIGDALNGIEIHSFDGGINVLLDNAELAYTAVYGLFADADNSDIAVTSTNGTIMIYNDQVGWYLITANGSVSIDVEDTTFYYGDTGILVESSEDIDANVLGSSFLGTQDLGMNLTADVNITLNVEDSVFDGQIAENAQLFYPTASEGGFIVIQPDDGDWTQNYSLMAYLPFDFEFNGATYNQVMMSLNGWISLGSDGSPDASYVYDFGPSSPNLIAPAQEYWTAFDPEMGDYFHGMGYQYDGDLNAVIFQWHVWKGTEPQLKNVFEVILYASGDIEFRYAMMDGYNVANYDVGINMYDGPEWNLDILDESVYYMDFQSVLFTTALMSEGAAIFAIANRSMVATIDSSSFSHYMGGGVLLVAVDGPANVHLEGSEFSFIYATEQTMGAFVAAAMTNPMTAEVINCTFDTIATAAIVLFDGPDFGGSDSFLVEGNHFNEVIMTAAMVTYIDDENYTGTGGYVSSKTFSENDGTHVGLMAIATVVVANDIAWSIQETDTIENNNFTGELNPWLLSSSSLLTVPYLGDIEVTPDLGVMNVMFVLESDVGDNQVTHTVSVAGNSLMEGPISEYYGLGQPMLSAVTIVEMAMMGAEASLTKQTNVSVVDNNVYSYNAPLVSGVEVFIGESLDNPVDGAINSNVFVNLVNNTLGSWYGDAVGIGFAAIQELNGGKGEGSLNVELVATDNMIDGFGEGIFVGVQTSAVNLFGDVVSDVNVLVQDNEVYSYGPIEVVLETSTEFDHYFPPYAQVIDSNATMMIDVGILNNTVWSYNDGITVTTEAQAIEDEYGVFANANASIIGPVNILDNDVTVYYDSFGISVTSYVSAEFSMASAVSDVPVTIVNNSIDATNYGAGIYVGNFASASTVELRFDDLPSALMTVNIDVSNNTIEGYSGIRIALDADATGGRSHATVNADVVVTANEVTGIYYDGISVDVSAWTDQIDYYPWAEVNVEVSITNNNVSGTDGTGISVTVLPGDGSDWYYTLSGSVSIVNNTISGTNVGINVSAQVPVVIFGNTITGVIEVDEGGILIEAGGSAVIEGNTISNIDGDGISGSYIYDVLIVNNTFENIGGSGVYLSGDENYTSYYLEVSHNTFTNIGDSGVEVSDIDGLWVLDNVMTNVFYYGVEVNDASNVFIENNTISEMFGGIELYNVYNANIMNNIISAGMMGVVIEESFSVTFADNEVIGNGIVGLLVIETEYLTMINGVFADNDQMGIELVNTSADWNVNANSSVLRSDVLFSGDLTVMAGGSLVLDSLEFGIMPDMRDGSSAINVMANGTLSAIDTEFYAASEEYDGFGVPNGDYYEFNVFGTLEFINVIESGAVELYLGAGSVAMIETSTIRNNQKNGIHVVDCSPVIMSCSIVSNPNNGILIEGSAAAPRITDCIIANNNRGIYALNTNLESVTDNLIVLNSEAGLFADNVSGTIHDNTFLFNHKEIYVRNSDITIQNNQIGYTPLVQLLVQFLPLLQGFNLSADLFLPELGLTISPSMAQNIIIGHVGIYAVDSVIRTSGNTYGMLYTAVQVVNSDLTFSDDVRQNVIVIPYMSCGCIIQNMTLPIPVWDGIVATDSHVVISGASIDVLDDAVFLDNSTADISSSTLNGADFDLYAIDGSNVTVTDSSFGDAKAEDTAAVDVWEQMKVVVRDPWGAALANVPVTVGSVDTVTDANGMALVNVKAYSVTSEGRGPMQSYAVSANLTEVSTSNYPGHSSWQTPVVTEQVTANGPTTIVMVSGVIVRFDLAVHAMDKDGKNAVNVTVMVHDASGNTVDQAQSDANGTAAFTPIGYIKNADGTTAHPVPRSIFSLARMARGETILVHRY